MTVLNPPHRRGTGSRPPWQSLARSDVGLGACLVSTTTRLIIAAKCGIRIVRILSQISSSTPLMHDALLASPGSPLARGSGTES